MRLPRLDSDFGSVLLGSANEGSRLRRIRIQVLISVSVVGANLIGVGLAGLLLTVGIPDPNIFESKFWWILFIAAPIYVGLAFLIGLVYGTSRILRKLRWAIKEENPTAAQAKSALRAPAQLSWMQAWLWGIATVLLTGLSGLVDTEMIPKVLLIIGLSGAVVCANSYLLAEFSLRPISARALKALPGELHRNTLKWRAIVLWAVGSGIPLIGIFLVAIFALNRESTSKFDLVISVFTLAAIALLTGSILTVLNLNSVAAPLKTVQTAMEKVRNGNTDVRVIVFDGSDIGILQDGFNRMVEGLSERERLRDLFGRHVGKEVVEMALEQGVSLGGEERTVAALFVDVIGSTTLATNRTPTEVVRILNDFFEVIIDVVDAHAGLVNKFEGDAVLAIFGAPAAIADPASAALSAARHIHQRLVNEVPAIQAGLGIGYGTVVAGHVGSVERYEYTVIGDPVNEAARLSELAKESSQLTVASGVTVAAANPDEAAMWLAAGAQVLRGRNIETKIFEPK